MFIRRATLSDVDSIAELHINSWRSAYSAIVAPSTLATMHLHEYVERWQAIISESNGTLLLAMDNGALQGFCHYIQDCNSATIKSIHVQPSKHRQGIASKLMRRTLSALIDDDLPHVVIWTFQENKAGIQFIEYHGFSFDGQLDRDKQDQLVEMRFKKGLPRL